MIIMSYKPTKRYEELQGELQDEWTKEYEIRQSNGINEKTVHISKYSTPKQKEIQAAFEVERKIMKREYAKEYNQRPEVKVRRNEYNKRPDVKENRKRYYNTPARQTVLIHEREASRIYKEDELREQGFNWACRHPPLDKFKYARS